LSIKQLELANRLDAIKQNVEAESSRGKQHLRGNNVL